MTKNNDEIDIDTEQNDVHNDANDITFDDVDEEGKTTVSLKKIREKLRACEDEKREFLNGWQRCKADSVNARKRDEDFRQASVQTAKEDVLMSVLPVLDSFEMAFSNAAALENIDPNWVAGMKHIQTQLVSVFGDYGIEQVNPEDEQFDPNAHESVEIREVKDKKSDDKVLEVIQKGYIINGRVLRAAKVVVGAFKK